MTAAALASSIRASERRSRAFLRLLAGMCRQFPDLRTWLLEDFGRDADTRASFLALVERGDLNGEAMSNGFAELAGELDGWLEEKRWMKAQLPAQTARPFGGLTWEEMEALVRRYEARTLGLNVFLLARDWRKAGEAAKASPRLLQAGADLLDTAIRSGETRQLVELGHAVELLAGLDPRRLRTAFGYADWWKLHALVYMMRHPREAYRTREVRAHLETLRLQISSLDFRRFCKRHGIRRDMRAGRPRTRSSIPAKR
ncbi:MAG TPA: hypothetical protein VG838_06945 [Opitutaceae bacterium]|nr:hypothetical protein [Lacunisphaera sp.]HWA09168.1 hypothetical protein [Opitutaceae bacterium]